MSYPRWVFFFITSVLTQGVGLDRVRGACEASSYVCVSLYSASKLFVYLFLGACHLFPLALSHLIY